MRVMLATELPMIHLEIADFEKVWAGEDEFKFIAPQQWSRGESRFVKIVEVLANPPARLRTNRDIVAEVVEMTTMYREIVSPENGSRFTVIEGIATIGVKHGYESDRMVWLDQVHRPRLSAAPVPTADDIPDQYVPPAVGIDGRPIKVGDPVEFQFSSSDWRSGKVVRIDRDGMALVERPNGWSVRSPFRKIRRPVAAGESKPISPAEKFAGPEAEPERKPDTLERMIDRLAVMRDLAVARRDAERIIGDPVWFHLFPGGPEERGHGKLTVPGPDGGHWTITPAGRPGDTYIVPGGFVRRRSEHETVCGLMKIEKV
jgi:hypothetical protein